MNFTYAISQGTTIADQLSWASASGLVEALALVMPSLALDFWRSRQQLAAVTASAIAIASLALATWSNLDYIRQVSGDKSVSRSAVAELREGLRQRIALAQAERSAIAENRSVDELTAAISRLRIAPWVATATANCATHGDPVAERQCIPHRRLAESRAIASHRDALDASIAAAHASLAALPATGLAAANPLRIILFALVPGALAGTVLMIARW